MRQREEIEQTKVIQYCSLRKLPVYAVPNGGKRNAKEAYYMKLSGTKAGVPDLCFPAARQGYHGMYIEMKWGKNKPTALQEEWIALLIENGYFVRVCYNFAEAKDVIDWYFGGGAEWETIKS